MLGALSLAQTPADVVELGAQTIGVGDQDGLRCGLALQFDGEGQHLGTGPRRRVLGCQALARLAPDHRLVVVGLLRQPLGDRLRPTSGTRQPQHPDLIDQIGRGN